MLTITVSPTESDQNPGTQDAPLQTLHEACNRVREIIKTFQNGQEQDITVKLEAGIHRLHETLILGLDDCCGNTEFEVTWEGDPDGETIISSGVPLTGWKRCEEDLADLPEGVRSRVWYVDLPAGTEVNTLYSHGGGLPRAQGAAIKPVQTSPLPEGPGRYGPDGPIKKKSGDRPLPGSGIMIASALPRVRLRPPPICMKPNS